MLIRRRIAMALAKSKKQPAPFKAYTRFDNWRSILIDNLNASRCHRWPTYTPPPGPPEVLDMCNPWDRHTFILRVLGEIPRSLPSQTSDSYRCRELLRPYALQRNANESLQLLDCHMYMNFAKILSFLLTHNFVVCYYLNMQ